VARAFSVPFAFNIARRDTLPDAGWDAVFAGRISLEHDHGVYVEPNA
jgi:hypothetical protein